MAKFKLDFEGLDEYLTKLQTLEDPSWATKRAVYEGASVMGKQILQAVYDLKVGKGGNVNEVQKQGLIEGFGYTKMKNRDGAWITRIGFDGYNADGQPNPMIANIVNSGTSKYPKTRFVDKAVKQATNACHQAMAESFEKDIEKLMKE